jgi:hypothetical protein
VFRFKTPLSNYKVEEGFQSIIIGNRSTTVSTTGMAMFRTNSGVLLQTIEQEIMLQIMFLILMRLNLK